MALVNATIRNAKPKAKPCQLTDAKGLFLLVTRSVGWLWKLKFRTSGGPERNLSLGTCESTILTERARFKPITNEHRRLQHREIAA